MGRRNVMQVVSWNWNQHSLNTWGAPSSARLKQSLSLRRGKQPRSHKPHMTTFTSHFKMAHILRELDVVLFTSLTSSCFSNKSVSPLFSVWPPASRLSSWGNVMEVKVCFRNHTYTIPTFPNCDFKQSTTNPPHPKKCTFTVHALVRE